MGSWLLASYHGCHIYLCPALPEIAEAFFAAFSGLSVSGDDRRKTRACDMWDQRPAGYKRKKGEGGTCFFSNRLARRQPALSPLTGSLEQATFLWKAISLSWETFLCFLHQLHRVFSPLSLIVVFQFAHSQITASFASEYLTIIHRSGGKYPPLSPTLRWIIVLVYTTPAE